MDDLKGAQMQRPQVMFSDQKAPQTSSLKQ